MWMRGMLLAAAVACCAGKSLTRAVGLDADRYDASPAQKKLDPAKMFVNVIFKQKIVGSARLDKAMKGPEGSWQLKIHYFGDEF